MRKRSINIRGGGALTAVWIAILSNVKARTVEEIQVLKYKGIVKLLEARECPEFC